MRELGIYIHIPFCKKKCDYCDFVSYAKKNGMIEKYIDSIIKEIDYISSEIQREEFNITTIYIGGGTPSYVEPKFIRDILEQLKKKLENRIKQNAIEVTIEINPGTVNKEKLIEYKDMGINRISIGLQSTKDDLLKSIGRIHTFEEFLEVYNLSRNIGFNNINIDIMLGLPGQTLDDIYITNDIILKLKPEHISVYSLIVEEGTLLYKKVQNGLAILPNVDIERDMYWKMKKSLEENEYKHYEISNFAKPGYESKHNMNCWKQKEYIGVGVAAHSYWNNTRFSNISNLEKYIENINNNNFSKNKIIHEIQNERSKMKEYVMIGLRKLGGVSISEFFKVFNEDLIKIFEKEIDKLIKLNLIEVKENTIKLTNKGLDFANLVWEEFV